MADYSINASNYGWGSLGITAATALANAITNFSSTKVSNTIAESQARIAELNAETMELQAQGAMRQGEKQIVQETMQAGQYKARQKTSHAHSGFALDSQSTVESLASSDITKEMNVNNIRSNATRAAWGYRMEAQNYKGQAIMARANKQSSGRNFARSLLSGASQVMNQYMALGAKGVWDSGTSAAADTTGKMIGVYGLVEPYTLDDDLWTFNPTSGAGWQPVRNYNYNAAKSTYLW